MSQSVKIPTFDITQGHPVRYYGDDNRFSAFASDMGFPPGDWPEELVLKNSKSLNYVKYQRKVHKCEWGPEGDLQSVHYEPVKADTDCPLTIFND